MRRLLILLSLVALAACDTADVPEPPGQEPPGNGGAPTAPLRASESRASFALLGAPDVADPFGLGLSAASDIGDMREQSQRRLSLSISGLWLAGTQDGTLGVNAVWYGGVARYDDGERGYGNFTTDCGGRRNGLFALDADTVYTDTDAWPRALGAPTTSDGSPRVYGDQMLWGSFCTDSVADSAPLASPLRGVRVNVAVFGYRDEPRVRYVRYEITNGGAPVPDLAVGYFADFDRSGEAEGFDAASGLSYVYSLATRPDGTPYDLSVGGFAFLSTPRDAPLFAHRIMRKGDDPDRPRYREFDEGVDRPQQLLYALQGRSNTGDPMTNPVTGETTRFAFTGDPFAGTGWRDGIQSDGSFQGQDNRQLTSLEPISLGTGESVTFTVALFTASGSTPSLSKREVDRLLEGARAAPERWRF